MVEKARAVIVSSIPQAVVRNGATFYRYRPEKTYGNEQWRDNAGWELAAAKPYRAKCAVLTARYPRCGNRKQGYFPIRSGTCQVRYHMRAIFFAKTPIQLLRYLHSLRFTLSILMAHFRISSAAQNQAVNNTDLTNLGCRCG